MSRNIYDQMENEIRNHQEEINAGKRVRINLFRSAIWPKGTIVGNPAHTKVLTAIAKKYKAKFRNFSESKFDHVATITWG